MDADAGGAGLLPQGLLDAVADGVRVLDGHAAGHDQVEFDEQPAAHGAGLDVMGLYGPLCVGGDHAPQRRDAVPPGEQGQGCPLNEP